MPAVPEPLDRLARRSAPTAPSTSPAATAPAFNFTDWGQDGNPRNPCGDPPGGVGAGLTPPTAEGGVLRSQDLRTPADPTTLDGAVLRVNPDTRRGMPDNPLAGSSDPNARRIIASRPAQPLPLNDQAGDERGLARRCRLAARWEEINRIADPLGSVENFGWPCYEGSRRQPGRRRGPEHLREPLREGPAQSSLPTTPTATTPRSSRASRAPTQRVRRSPASPSTRAGPSRPPTTARSSSPTTRATASGSCSRAETASRTRTTARRSWPRRVEPGRPGGRPRRRPLLRRLSTAAPIRRIMLRPTSRRSRRDRLADERAGPAHRQLQRQRLERPGGRPLTYAWDLDADGAFDDSTAAPRPSHTPPRELQRQASRHRHPGQASRWIGPNQRGQQRRPSASIDAPAARDDMAGRRHDRLLRLSDGSRAGYVLAARPLLRGQLVLQHCPADCHSHPVQTFSGVRAARSRSGSRIPFISRASADRRPTPAV